MVVVRVADKQDFYLVEGKSQRLDILFDLRHILHERAIDQDVSLGGDDEIRGQIFRADIEQISRDAMGRDGTGPRRIQRLRTQAQCTRRDEQNACRSELPAARIHGLSTAAIRSPQISIARSRRTPREPFTSTTSPGSRVCASHFPASSALGKKSDATPLAQAAWAK